VDDLRSHKVLDAVAEMELPLLILHSPVDDVVDISHARAIYEAAQHPKSFVSLDRADHLLLQDPADARHVAAVVAAWVERYLDLEDEPEAAEEKEELEHGVVLVRGGTERYRQEVRARDHLLIADEPTDVGGGDLGPTPYDLLLAALGSCTSMTLRMYADRKEWDLQEVEVRLRHQKIHAKDCEDCATEKGKIDRIEREISVTGDLDDGQRERLLEIADRCPVHRTLTSETVIRSRLV
jgi:putative redox protein